VVKAPGFEINFSSYSKMYNSNYSMWTGIN